VWRGHRNHRNVESLFLRYPLQLADIVNGNAASRLVADFLVGGVEKRRDFEAFLAETRVVRERQTEVAGAHDGDTEVAVETENLPQMAAEVLDVVADAANAELAEVGQVLADLRRVQVKLLCQRLGRNRLHAARIELVQAAQVHGQAVCGQFRHLIGGLAPLVRPIHKRKWYCKVLELDVGANAFLPRTVGAAVAALMLLTPVFSVAQPPPRRLATIGGLRQFPGFYHLQNILLRGEFKGETGKIMFEAEDGNIRSILDNGVPTSSGRVEIRGQLIDIGRLEPGDPRVPDSEMRDVTRWPRPGEELFVRVTAVTSADAPPALSIRTLALEPWRYAGQKVTVTGNFRGRNLFGDLPGAPGKSRFDFVIRGAEGAAWVAGLQPKGRGFDLDIDKRFDTDKWLAVTGVVAYERGLVRIDATELATAPAPQLLLQADEPAAPPPVLPTLEVVFSSPTPGEEDVEGATPVRIQFSRGLDPKSIGGSIRVSYLDSTTNPPSFQATYDAATRAVTMKFSRPLEPGRVRIDVVDTLRAFDGAPAKPWTVTFTIRD
jgi:hypothetical protein